jgi:Mg/Co/Ni transporter MgtE
MVSTRRSSTSPKDAVSNDTPSAINELKETIRKQAKEIESLKAKIHESDKASLAPTTVSHGHGPPMGDEDPNSYISSPFYKLAFRRVGWLAFFLCSLSLTAVIMNGFEHTLSRQIELAYFVPLLAGHGGNTGGQCVGSVLSALSTGAITTKDGFRIIKKEALAGATVGTVLGAAVAFVAHYVGGISEHVSVVVFCTLPLLSTIAGTLASSIPFLCVIMGVDPALIAAPAMTSFVDVTGLLSYFLIANKVFQWFGLKL